MRIQSKLKDYYDYVEYLYSQEGGDPSNYYHRGLIKGLEEKVVIEVRGEIPPLPRPFVKYGDKRSYKGWEDFPWRFKWCVVCGKLYLLYCKSSYPVCHRGWPSDGYTHIGSDDWELVSEGDHVLGETTRSNHVWGKYENVKIEEVRGVFNETCQEISKTLTAPVFTIDRVALVKGKGCLSRVEIDNQVPLLSKLGFPATITAEKMYQDISMFLGSLKGNPDDSPPVEVSDRDRLIQKGFDEKKSFRGKL